MRRLVFPFLLALVGTGVQAADGWQFDSRIAVTPEPARSTYHHLDGAGRRHIAVSGGMVAVTWEDDRSGDPQVYAAILSADGKAFEGEVQLSNGDEAFEPGIAALAGGGFVVAWEQDGGVHLASLSADADIATRRVLVSSGASQPTLAAGHGRLEAAWRERIDGAWYLRHARLDPSDSSLQDIEIHAVEPNGTPKPVLFPSLALTPDGSTIGWEDRREGHTRILYAFSPVDNDAFTEPLSLNEFFANRNEYDKGSGAMRVALAAMGEDEIVAAWMDKRRMGAGHGIFATFGAGAPLIFGPNEKVHGEVGDRQPHYNPSVAGDPDGNFVIAWDDFRSGTLDIWLSNYNDDLEWSDDYSPPPASGDGEQSHPSVTLDDAGNLHMLWIERADPNAPTQLWYARGTPR